MSKPWMTKRTTAGGAAAEIVFGADIVMSRSEGEYRLYAPGAEGHRRVGSYTTAAAAWAALDEIDDPMNVPLSRVA